MLQKHNVLNYRLLNIHNTYYIYLFEKLQHQIIFINNYMLIEQLIKLSDVKPNKSYWMFFKSDSTFTYYLKSKSKCICMQYIVAILKLITPFSTEIDCDISSSNKILKLNCKNTYLHS